MERIRQLNQKVAKDIVGQKIIAVQIVDYTVADDDSDEDNMFPHFTAPLVEIHLENNVGIYAQSDDEFNDVGIIVAIMPGKDAEPVYLNYEEEKEDD